MNLPGQKQVLLVNGRFLTQRLTGVQRFAYQIVKQLLTQNTPLVVLVPPKPLCEQYDVEGWPLVTCGFGGGQLWEQLSLPLFLMKRKTKEDPAVLLNLCNTAPVLYTRNILTLHDVAFIDKPEWFKKSFVLAYRSIMPLLLKRSLFVMTVSEFSKQVIQKYYPSSRSKTDVVYNAPTVLPASTEGERAGVLAKLGLRKKRYILSVGSLEPRKNLHTLIEAFFQVKDKEVDLVLVGSKGNVFNSLTLDTKGDSRIKLAGYVTDKELKILYSNALCFVYPSLYEGFGLPPVEAMCNECPVIVSDIPSLKEVCDEAALFADPQKPEDFAGKLNLLIGDASLQQKMIASGVERTTNFSWRSSADKLIELVGTYGINYQRPFSAKERFNLPLSGK